jgi:sec-independent protein translocase protein TatA
MSPSFFAFIDGLGGPEMMLIFLIVLLLFGGKRLPDFAKGLGKSVREFKRAAAGVEDEIKRAIDSAPSADAPKPLPNASKPRETPATAATERPAVDPHAPKDFLS